MTATISYTLLAYLLALKDYSASLSAQDKENFKIFAKNLDLYPTKLKSDHEPFLKEKIAENEQLNQLFQVYQHKLSQCTEIPWELILNLESLYQLEQGLGNQSTVTAKKPIPGNHSLTSPDGQEKILHNICILTSKADEPEKIINDLPSFDQLKKHLPN